MVPGMKKSLPRLTVHRETLRALAALELARAVGGDTAQTITCRVNCSTGLVKLLGDNDIAPDIGLR